MSEEQYEFFLQTEQDLTKFLRNISMVLFESWSGGSPNLSGLPDCEAIFALFQRLGYCGFTVSSGLPRNDYGQTVRLTKSSSEDSAGVLSKGGTLPETWNGFDTFCGNSERTDRLERDYRLFRRRMEDGSLPSIEERWFFRFRPGYKLKSFSELARLLEALLPFVTHITFELDQFSVGFLENGIYVWLLAIEDPNRRLPLKMGT